MKTILWAALVAAGVFFLGCGADSGPPTIDDPAITPESGGGSGACSGPYGYCLFTWPGTTNQYLAQCAQNPNGFTVCCGGCIDANGICQDGGSNTVCGALSSACHACATGTGCNPAVHACEQTCSPNGSPCGARGTCQNGYCQ